jgi:flavin-dependent dehydrogenase
MRSNNMSRPPEKTQILVIGGGPGGAVSATLLARAGFDVTLLEQSRFPRYHIGESLLPSILQIMDLIGAREKFESFGFQRKFGAYLEWGQERWPLNFGELGGNNTYAFQVVRSEFDLLLLEHARSQGVKVFEEVEVRDLAFENARPRSATYLQTGPAQNNGGAPGEISFDFLIDASGRSSIMTTRFLRNRRYHKVFQNIALWGYWKDADRLATGREGDIAVSSISNGWLWAIPLHDGTMSVGVVMHRDSLPKKQSVELEKIYEKAIAESKLITNITSSAELVSNIHSETDYSYTSDQFSGPGFFLVGDAACFLDPLLSSGVHLATFSGMLAAASITSILCDEVGEEEASIFFEKSYRQAYLRFLVFLSAFYDINRGKESYFWEAQRLTEQDIDTSNLKQAFLKLVTGLKDLSDAQSDSHHLVLQEMSKRIDENLHLRQDKDKLASLDSKGQQAAEANANFFSSVEGMFSLDQEEAIDGLYVSTSPRLHLARVAEGS